MIEKDSKLSIRRQCELLSVPSDMPRSPWENGGIESFFSCLEREVFQRFEIEDFKEMRRLFSEYVEFYNNERMHGT